MYNIYFDESKYPQKDFIISTFVFCKEDPNKSIEEILKKHGFDPLTDEYKSSVHFGRNPKMAEVREALKEYFGENCFFAIVVSPFTDLKNLGFNALKALKHFLIVNNLPSNNNVYFDEGIFTSKSKAVEFIEQQQLNENIFYLEQDSKDTKGIQLADLCSHCLTTMLREAMGDLIKMVKAPENSGYDPETEMEIGFDIWASIRYNFLREVNKEFVEGSDQEAIYTYKVEPYGIYFSESCTEELITYARKNFSTVYLGCIH